MKLRSLTFAFSPAVTTENGSPRQFSGVAYSGGIIPNYGEFGDAVIDLASAQLPENPIFTLVNHDENQRAGYANVTSADNQLSIAGSFSTATPCGQQVAAEFADGAPWQLSVGFNAQEERFKKPTEIEMNGRKLTVSTIFRNASIREVSFVPVGADPHTTAFAFSPIQTPTAQVESNLGEIMDEQLNDLLNCLRYRLNLPTLATPAEIKAELDKFWQMLSDNAAADGASTDNTVAVGMSGQLLKLTGNVKSKLSALEVKLAQQTDETSKKAARVVELETELKELHDAQRLGEVEKLFALSGRELTDELKQSYVNLDEATFKFMRSEMESIKPKTAFAAHLFQDTATHGKTQNVESLQDSAQKLFNQVAKRA